MTEVDRRPEDVGEILVKVQEDLHHLRDQLLQRSLTGGTKEIIDIRTLESAIEKTQDGIRAQSEKILSVVNNRVTTLPSVDASRANKLVEAPNREAVWDISALEELSFRKNAKSFNERKLSQRFTAIDPSGGGGPFGPSPGQATKFQTKMKAITDPTSNQNRKVLSENYGVSLPLIVDKRKKPLPPPQKVVIGSTVDHLAVLPKANRVDPQLIPPPIQEKDARKGILSLMERGLIPPAAELTLDPNPVRQKLITMYDPRERKDHKGNGLTGDGILAQVKMDLDTLTRTKDATPIPSKVAKMRPLTASSDGDKLTWAQSSMHSGKFKPGSAKSGKSLSLVPVKDGPLPPPTTPASEFRQLHHRFSIQHGKVRENNKDFLAFKQHYCLSWGNIVTMLKHLEKFLASYAVPVAFVYGDRLADLAIEYELEKHPTKKELLNTLINLEDVQALISRPGRRYLGPDGEHVAATRIQSTWRRYQDRLAYLDYRKKKWAAGVIAISWVMHVKMAKIRKQLKLSRKQQLEWLREKTQKFQKSWNRIKKSRRVLLHLPSLGYSQKIRASMNDFNILQNQQMSRLCDLLDPNVEVIYISPVPLNDETLQYYNKLLGLQSAVHTGNVEEQQDMSQRFKIIIPEAANSFPTHSMCLATLLKYSPHALERIKHLIVGKDAYIVPGVMHKDDVAVAHLLNIAVLGSEPEVAHLYSTKSGSKRIFSSAKVDIPPSDYDVYSLQQLHESLAQLVTDNLDVKRYLFKLDDEVDGRGIAYCDVTPNLRCHMWAKKESERYGEKWNKRWAQEPAYIKIHAEIPDILAKHAKPVNNKVFPAWEVFLEAFLSQGGVIEACPPSDSVTALSVNMLIEPNNELTIVSCGDQIHAESPFGCWGLSIPQSSVDPGELNIACRKIAQSCHQRGVMGYFTIDFVTFIDPISMEQKLWAVDLNLWYDDSVGLTQLMLFVTGGKLDNKNCVFEVPPPIKEKKKVSRRRYEELDDEGRRGFKTVNQWAQGNVGKDYKGISAHPVVISQGGTGNRGISDRGARDRGARDGRASDGGGSDGGVSDGGMIRMGHAGVTGLGLAELVSARLQEGDMDPQAPPSTTRYAVLSTRLWHTNLAVVHYSVFFQMCRAHGIGFDIKERQGTVFTLIDNYKRENVGMLSVGEDLQGALASFARNLSVIHQEISAPNMQGTTNFKHVITDIEGILGTTLQNMDRKEDKEDDDDSIIQDVD